MFISWLYLVKGKSTDKPWSRVTGEVMAEMNRSGAESGTGWNTVATCFPYLWSILILSCFFRRVKHDSQPPPPITPALSSSLEQWRSSDGPGFSSLLVFDAPSKPLQGSILFGQNVVPDHICLLGLQNKYPASLMHQDINNNVNSAHFMQIVLIHAKMR